MNSGLPLGNTRQGVRISSSDKNRIGSSGEDDLNIIAFNGQAGVYVEGGTMNSILRNSIHSNGGRGIALTDSAPPLPNDADDPDGGSNNRQNYPIIDTADLSGANVVLPAISTAWRPRRSASSSSPARPAIRAAMERAGRSSAQPKSPPTGAATRASTLRAFH